MTRAHGSISEGLDGSQAAFVWPPIESQDEPISADAPTIDADPPIEAPVGVLASLERDLLGVRSLSFARWAAASGWRPDTEKIRCWRCAGSVGPFETDGDGCAACRAKKLAWSRAVRLGKFEGGLRTAVLELKFGRWRRTGRELGRAMGRQIAASLEQIDASPDEAVIVPVPTHWRRRLSRGVDHTRVLGKWASAESGLAVVRAMTRRHSRAQVGLSATARAANVRGVFGVSARRAIGLGEKRVIVVLDDVRTTGATMTAACRAVRKAAGRSPEIWCCVAGVATDRRGSGASGVSGGPEDQKFGKTFGAAV